MTRPEPRRGFTLIELLISVVIAGILLISIYQVLVTNQRISMVQSEQIIAQQTVRAGMDLLSQELREVSSAGGDLLVANAERVEFRALRTFGIACLVDPPSLRVVIQGRPFDGNRPDVYVFLEGDPMTATDDEWVVGRINELPMAVTCPGDRPARRLVLGDLTADHWSRARVGAMVRAFERVSYHIASDATGTYLARTIDAQTVFLAGPLQAEGGIVFTYLDGAGIETVTLADIRQIRITIRTQSDVVDQLGRDLDEALTTTVFLRN